MDTESEPEEVKVFDIDDLDSNNDQNKKKAKFMKKLSAGIINKFFPDFKKNPNFLKPFDPVRVSKNLQRA